MRYALIPLLSVCLCAAARTQDESGVSNTRGPANEKAQKTYREGVEYLRQHKSEWALDRFKKADKQDGGHCLACQKEIAILGLELRDWKAAENAAEAMIPEERGGQDLALAHYQLAMLFFREGIDKHKDELFSRAHEELTKALEAGPNFPEAVFLDGDLLANLHQDEAARAQFKRFVEMSPGADAMHQRALRFIERPELARSRIAPAFTVTTMDGQRLSLDALQGKVVLLDFWATWCGPCREALPHVRDIAKKFSEQPFVVLSVSLDHDQRKWKDFVQKNGMTWPQYWDGGFGGPIATLFEVHAIPHTFTIDADGMLHDEHVGDASIEGKLKKLVSRAQELQASKKPGE